MSYIIDFVFIHEFLCNHPWTRVNDFINPFAMFNTVFQMKINQLYGKERINYPSVRSNPFIRVVPFSFSVSSYPETPIIRCTLGNNFLHCSNYN